MGFEIEYKFSNRWFWGEVLRQTHMYSVRARC
jgi:hypothetical protein